MKNVNKIIHKVSKLFQPVQNIPKDIISSTDINSKSQKLMLDLGLIKSANPGSYHLLPLTMRSLNKLVHIVRSEMDIMDGQQVSLPSLIHKKLWDKTGRYEQGTKELFQLNDRHQQNYILSPTDEESITDMLAHLSPISPKILPLKLYQISSKYRDERKPRFGLMRARQFIMKDMYSFDATLEEAQQSYKMICNSYDRILTKIGVPFRRVEGACGTIGGLHSHEFHYEAEIGEDMIVTCKLCHYAYNAEVCTLTSCPKCAAAKDHLVSQKSIEVGHTFLLGDRYTKPLGAQYASGQIKKSQNLQMGSYGLGISRILGAVLEVSATDDMLKWPIVLAPFCTVIIPPKAGSNEEKRNAFSTEELYDTVSSIFPNDVLIDDRTEYTIGRRLFEARRMGYPIIIVLGKSIMEPTPLIEVHDNLKNQSVTLPKVALQDFLLKFHS